MIKLLIIFTYDLTNESSATLKNFNDANRNRDPAKYAFSSENFFKNKKKTGRKPRIRKSAITGNKIKMKKKKTHKYILDAIPIKADRHFAS